MTLSHAQREELRLACLRFLAERSSAAYPADLITNRINGSRWLDFAATHDDVTGALDMLTGMDLLKGFHSRLGASKHFQISPAGLLAWERGDLLTPR